MECMVCSATITTRTGMFMEDDQGVYGPKGCQIFVCNEVEACEKRANAHIEECA